MACAVFFTLYTYFNPRSREGSDLKLYRDMPDCNHFNPRSREGSDRSRVCRKLSASGFQSTLPRGERLKVTDVRVERLQFQSTLPRGERPYTAGYQPMDSENFNPRSREGSDVRLASQYLGLNSISIHAPARGATTFSTLLLSQHEFQSTLPRGERPDNIYILSNTRKFQSTLPRGERQKIYNSRLFVSNFNPRSREGSDDGEDGSKASKFDISIHAPARGATWLLRGSPNPGTISIHAPARGATRPSMDC